MSMTATADWRWIADRPELVKEIEQPKTARPSKYRFYAQVLHVLTHAVEQHWNEMDERFRHLLRVFVACTFEPKGVFTKWDMLLSSSSVLVAFVVDREAVGQYIAAASVARKAVLTAIERESPEYQGTLAAAIAEVTKGTTGRSTMTAREASELTRSL